MKNSRCSECRTDTADDDEGRHDSEKEKLEYVWSPLEERALILMLFSTEEALVQMGGSLDIEWFEGRKELDPDQIETPARKIAGRVEEPEELESLMNHHELKDRKYCTCSFGGYYHAVLEEDEMKIEGTRNFIDLKRIREELKALKSSDSNILPLMRGILLSVDDDELGCRVSTDFKDAVYEARKFYGDENLSLEDIKRLPGKLTGIYSRDIGGRWHEYTFEICYTNIVWEAVEHLENAE